MSILLKTIDQMNGTINQLKVELERTTSQDSKILEAIKELKEDIDKKGSSSSSAKFERNRSLRMESEKRLFTIT